jgi:ADP-heptose:LPS heptosyltransferase
MAMFRSGVLLCLGAGGDLLHISSLINSLLNNNDEKFKLVTTVNFDPLLHYLPRDQKLILPTNNKVFVSLCLIFLFLKVKFQRGKLINVHPQKRIVQLGFFILGQDFFTLSHVDFMKRKENVVLAEDSKPKYVQLRELFDLAGVKYIDDPKVIYHGGASSILGFSLPCRYLTAAPGAGNSWANGRNKRAPLRLFFDVAKRLNLPLVFVGNAGDFNINESGLGGFPIGCDVYDLTGKTTFDECYNVIASSVGFLGNDSMPAFFAAAAEVNAAVFYGPTSLSFKPPGVGGNFFSF